MIKITLKCFATLSRHLPTHAKANAAEVEISENMSVHEAIDHFHIDRQEAHLVILNGLFVCPEERDTTFIKAGDTLAVWPEVAGG